MRWSALLSFVLVIPSVAQAQITATRIAPQKGWLSSLDQAKAQARKTGKPIFLVFRCDP